jgi:arginase family enzyme
VVYSAPNGKQTRLTLHIVELGFSSDLRHQDKYDQKTAHYTPLITALSQAGWNVHQEAHVITIGVRATVPDRNHKVLQTLGITNNKDRKQLQNQFVHTSAKHHAMIITQIRKQTRILGKQGVG